jgi:hypothetical protein
MCDWTVALLFFSTVFHMLSEWLGAASSDAVDETRWVCSPSVPFFLPGPSRFIYFSIIQENASNAIHLISYFIGYYYSEKNGDIAKRINLLVRQFAENGEFKFLLFSTYLCIFTYRR